MKRKFPLYFRYGNNIFSLEFLHFLFVYYILKRTHAQFGCSIHHKQLLYNGECRKCFMLSEITTNNKVID